MNGKQQKQKEELNRLIKFIRQTPDVTTKICIAAGFKSSFLATFYITALRRARLQKEVEL